MLNASDRLIKSSRLVVRTALVANRLFFVAVVVGLVVSWIWPAQLTVLLMQPKPGSDLGSVTAGMRWLMLLGLAMAAATEVLLTALTQIIASAGAGDPFIPANGRRLQTIGWALLALQLMDIPGAVLERFFPSLSAGGPSISFAPGGWIAVLMVFVLSRVFAAGSAMRAELEGTV